MDAHCKGCIYHHTAGHPKGTRLYRSKYEDWCVRFGTQAKLTVGHCKNKNAKQTPLASS